MATLVERVVVPPRLALILRGGQTIGFDPDRNLWHWLTPETAEVLRWLRAGRSRDRLPAHIERRFRRTQGADLVEQILKWSIVRRLLYLDKVPSPPRLLHTARLDSVYWICTQACNLRCTYCYQDATVRRPNELTTPEALDLVDQIIEAGAGTLVFTGGEPFSRRDLLQVARHSRATGLRTNVITNGHYVTRRNVDRIADIFHRVTVSLDSGSPHHHDAMRGEGSWARAAKAIDLLLEAGVHVDVNSTLTRDGAVDAEELLRYVHARNVGTHRCTAQSPMGRGQGHRDDELATNDFLDLDYAMHALRAEDPNTQNDKVFRHKAEQAKGQFRNHCGAGLSEVSVDPEGWVYPCKLLQQSEYRCANIRDRRIKEQWISHPILVRIQKPFIDTLEPCSNCVIRHHCGGGCRGIHASTSGAWDKVDPMFCAQMRRSFEVMAFASNGAVPGRARAEFVGADGVGTLIGYPSRSVFVPVQDLFRPPRVEQV